MFFFIDPLKKKKQINNYLTLKKILIGNLIMLSIKNKIVNNGSLEEKKIVLFLFSRKRHSPKRFNVAVTSLLQLLLLLYYTLSGAAGRKGRENPLTSIKVIDSWKDFLSQTNFFMFNNFRLIELSYFFVAGETQTLTLVETNNNNKN